MLRGIYHAHSTYSYDGHRDIGEISAWADKYGFDFVILTEHDFDFSDKKFNKYLAECRNNSTTTFIPGIEYSFECNKGPIHISVFGLNEFIDLKENPMSILEFLEHVHKLGGFSVLNHSFRVIDEVDDKCFEVLDFIETWNHVYDIKYSPNKKIINYSRKRNFQGKFLASSDIHRWLKKNRFPYIELSINGIEKTEKDIIDSIVGGEYTCNSRFWKIHPDGTFSPVINFFKPLPSISLAHQLFYEGLRDSYYRKFKIVPPKWLIKILK